MKVDLYLDGQKVDGLGPSETIAITRQAAKWSAITQRNADFSNVFQLVKTNALMNFFEHPDKVGSISGKPYTRVPFSLEVNELPIAAGFAVLVEAKKFIELQLFSGLADFFDELGDIQTSDIDISDQNHRWTQTNINNLRDRTAETGGVVYPLINYRRMHVRSPQVAAVADWYPAIYAARYINDALSGISYTMEGFDERFVLPFCKKDFEGENIAIGQVSANAPQSGTSLTTYDIVYTTIDSNPVNAFQNVSGRQGYQCFYNGSYSYRIFAQVSMQNGGFFQLVVGGSVVFSQAITPGPLQTVNVEGSFNFTSSTGNATTPQIDAYLRLSTIGNYVVGAGLQFQITSHIGKTLVGGWVDCNRLIDPISIKDLLLYYAARTCSLVFADPVNRVLRFVRLDDAMRQIPVDWSDYFDPIEDPRIQFRLGDDYAQRNEFATLPPPENDPFRVEYRNFEKGVIEINDSTLPPKKEVANAFFCNTYTKRVQQDFDSAVSIGEQVPTILRYTAPAISYLSPDIEPKQRIGIIDLETDPDYARFIPDDWATLIDANYNALKGMFDRTKVVEALVRLPLSEFVSFDPTRPVYIMGQLWFVRQIKQYKVNESDSTLIELIRL